MVFSLTTHDDLQTSCSEQSLFSGIYSFKEDLNIWGEKTIVFALLKSTACWRVEAFVFDTVEVEEGRWRLVAWERDIQQYTINIYFPLYLIVIILCRTKALFLFEPWPKSLFS